jgi:hypothetical protein
MDREAHAREVLVRLVEDQRTAVQRAVEQGGLPAEQDAADAYRDLMRARDRLEALVWRVEGIGESSDGSDLPRPVTLEDIGIVSVIASDAERMAGEIADFATQLQDAISALDQSG